ncbi:MAG: antibiotic biosynthesis monooxygenase [Nannocystaceae bacterium]
MIVEYIRYTIPAARDAAFLAAYERASASLRASPVCLAYELTRCDEAPERYILRIEWTSVEGHLRGFRGGPEFAGFFQAVRPFLDDIEEMHHYTRTDLVWSRG